MLRLLAVSAAALTAQAAAASPAADSPFFAWSNVRSRTASPAVHAGSFTRQDAAAIVSTAISHADGSKLPLEGSANLVSAFVFDVLPSDDLSKLAAAHARAPEGTHSQAALAGLSAVIAKGRASLTVSRAQFGGGSVAADLAAAAASSQCAVFVVQADGAGPVAGATVVTRDSYLAALRAGKVAGHDGCAAFIVQLTRSQLAADMRFVASAVAALEAAPEGVHHLTMLTAEPAAAPAPRVLQASPTPAVTVAGIYITSEVLQGLLIGLLLIFFTYVGLYCTMSVNTPDQLHSTALPAGKEY